MCQAAAFDAERIGSKAGLQKVLFASFPILNFLACLVISGMPP
jgi:hypothetical protein